MAAVVQMILMASWPFVNFLAVNAGQPPYFPSILGGWALYILALASVYLAARLLFRGTPAARFAIVLGIASLVFFNFLTVSKLLITFGVQLGIAQAVIWLALFIASIVVAWLASNSRATAIVLLVVGLVMVGVPGIQFAMSLASDAGSGASDRAFAAPDRAGTQRAHRPNVYWINLDGYARDDILARHFGFSADRRNSTPSN